MSSQQTVELFCGTKSASKVFESRGYDTFTVDASYSFHPDLTADIRNVNAADLPHAPLILWASPPCQGFSVAAIGKNWNHDNTPKTDSARLAMVLAEKTISLIGELQPTWWFIENPCGKLRKLPFMDVMGESREISYCHYGDMRLKPTDIWTNAHWWKPRSKCHNQRASHPVDCCCRDHEAAPRGSKTGTQGIHGDMDRSRIPPALFEEILDQLPQ